MRISTPVVFVAGAVAGGVCVWLLSPGPAPPPPPPERPASPTPAAGVPASGKSGVPDLPQAVPKTVPKDAPDRTALRDELASLRAELEAARAEGRRKVVEALFEWTIDGRDPGKVLEPYRDIPPDPGHLRFAAVPPEWFYCPWQFLCNLAVEDMDQAVEESLNHMLRWSANLAGPEERAYLRECSARSLRAGADFYRCAETLRRRLQDDPPADEAERLALKKRREELLSFGNRCTTSLLQGCDRFAAHFRRDAGK